MEFKATKGWKLQDDGVIIDENYNVVADFMILDKTDLYNAKLTQKAPEMLEILKDINNDLDIWDSLPSNVQKNIYTLIKEATEL